MNSEALQERVDVDVGQLLGLVRLVQRFERAVCKGGIQLQDQIFYVRWRPRRRRLTSSPKLAPG